MVRIGGTEVHPQGSMALRTTVRPLHGDEFDVDLVCQMDGWTGGPMDLHKALGARLAEHAQYAKMLEPKKRCWTLNYAGDLHLDALPARDDRERSHDNSIEVPDRKTPKEWKPNPKDFIARWITRSPSSIPLRGTQRLEAPR